MASTPENHSNRQSVIRRAKSAGAQLAGVTPLTDGKRIAVHFTDGTDVVSDIGDLIANSWLYSFLSDYGSFVRAYVADDEIRWPTPPNVEWPPYVEATLEQLADRETNSAGWLDEVERGPGLAAVVSAIHAKRFLIRDVSDARANAHRRADGHMTRT